MAGTRWNRGLFYSFFLLFFGIVLIFYGNLNHVSDKKNISVICNVL